MGAGESVVAVEQESASYKDFNILNYESSKNFEKVLRFYEVIYEDDVSHLEESLCLNPPISTFVVVLINQNAPARCFSMHRAETKEEGEKHFKELCDLLIPVIDHLPSAHHSATITALVKLRKSYPMWNVDKIAEYLQLPEFKTNQNVICASSEDKKEICHQKETLELIQREQPSFAREIFGSTPLQYLTERHPELVANFVSTIDALQQTGKDIKGALDNITRYTESPIHVAIRLSQESVLQLLLEKGVNSCIPCGHAYPIHLSMKHESKGCTKLLLKHDRECLSVKDKKYLGSALHWAKNTEQIDLLAAHDEIDFNCRNSTSETPLHVMVKRGRLSPCISLVCHGADVNSQDDDGVTPLHLAVLNTDMDIIKGLLLLGADSSLVDNRGLTALDYAEQNAEFYIDIKEIFAIFSVGVSTQPSVSSKTPRTQSLLKERTGKEALLSLDGGGIRGLILAEVLLALESISGHNIYELFDWVSGTSTGSYLALSIANGKSIRYVQRAYLRLGRSCFIGIRPYPTELVDAFLINEFGKETKMDEVKFPKLIIPAVLADRRPAMLHLFRNYDAPYDDHYQMRDARFPRPPLPADQLVWLANRSSCSAPSYFRSTGRYLDGGLIANNPTLDALSEIHKHEEHFKRKPKDARSNVKVVVSIGTGKSALQPLRPIDIYRPSSLWDTAEIVDNLKCFVDLMVDQVSASDDHVVDRARSWCEMAGIKYNRLNPMISGNIEMNETDDRLIISMLCDVRKFIETRADDLRRVARQLLNVAQDV